MNQARMESLQWDIDVPLLTNRHMVSALAQAMLGAAAIVALLVGLLLGVQGEWRLIPRIAGLLLAIGGALFLFGLVVMAFPFRNRLATRFTLDDEGARLAVMDDTARIGSRLGFWAGLALGNAAATGSGLLATIQQEQVLRWGGSFRVVFEQATHSIAFRNGWRTLMRIYCLPGNFDAAIELVGRQMARHGTAARVRPHSPVRTYLLRTLLVLVASLPLFAVSDTYAFGLLLPWLLLCFGVAMVWFVRQLAWVVLGDMAVIFAMMLAGAAAERVSSIDHSTYYRYQTLSGDDWALTVLAIAGSALIAWLAIATLRENIRPALAQDMIDAGEGQ